MKHLTLLTEAYRVILSEFTKYIEARGFSKSCREYTPASVQEFLFRLEDLNVYSVSFVKPNHIWSHYEHLTQRENNRKAQVGLSASVINSHLYSLGLFFGWLVQLKAIAVNPITCLEFPKLYSPSRIALPLTSIESLYEVYETQLDLALLGLHYGCGLRRSEAEALDIRDVNWSRSCVVVRRGKFGKRREVPLHSKIRKDLRQYYEGERMKNLHNHESINAFLVNWQGRRVRGKRANVRIQYLAQQGGIKGEVTLHVLRHSIATHLLDRGMGIGQISTFLGHSSLDVTERYLLGHSKSWRKKQSHYTHNKTKLYQT